MSDFETTMNKSVVYADPGASLLTEIIESPIPEPGHGEVLVRLSYSGVCHTDIGFCLNLFDVVPAPTPKGQVGGHEGIGVVIKQGQGVTYPDTGSTVGISYAADACLSCENCLLGGETTCTASKISGYFTAGTFQQFIVAPARYVIPIPQGLEPSMAAPLMCGGLSVYASLKRATVRPGAWVVVCGAGGGLGHLGIQYAKAMNARVVALDTAAKRQLCMDLGANVFFDFAAYDEPQKLTDEVLDATGGGASVVLMCTSSSRAYAQAMAWLGFRGTLACLGIPKEDLLVPRIIDMITKETRIIATKAGNRLEAQECLQIAAQGGIKVETQIRRMDELTEVFNELESGHIQGRAVIDLS
ncbi:alcohol dehydrogenase groES-like domain-containing protein [Sarocladium implicatum]|nr:alcohol dehydrogenase groES-like domain-containing protein [Sarocladium implicatum]